MEKNLFDRITFFCIYEFFRKKFPLIIQRKTRIALKTLNIQVSLADDNGLGPFQKGSWIIGARGTFTHGFSI